MKLDFEFVRSVTDLALTLRWS